MEAFEKQGNTRENKDIQRKIKVLMICHGNICRSPISEFVLKDMVEKRGIQDQFEIASAATSTEEIWGGRGNPIYPPAQAVLRATLHAMTGATRITSTVR